MTAWTEREYKIGTDHSEGHYISVVPAPDYPEDGILLFTDGEKNEAFFGKIYLMADTSFMKAIGQALLDCAKDLENAKNDR